MIYYSEDGSSIDVKVKDGKIKVQANSGYAPGVKTLLTLKDNGNGYYVRSKSYLSTQPDRVFNLDYSEIEYLYFAYKAILEGKENGN